MLPTLGTSLDLMGPGLSARIRYTAPSPSLGISARNSTSTPMPPIHWVSERHSRTLRDRCSTSGNTVEPVVVRPDTVSNTASTYAVSAPVNT